MPNLKDNHPALYQRVRALGITHILLGGTFFFIGGSNGGRSATALAQVISLSVWGWIFIAVGILMLIGVFQRNNHFRLTRTSLIIAVGYEFMWLLALVLVSWASPASSGITVLWAYFTWNIYTMITDPGWASLELLKVASEA